MMAPFTTLSSSYHALLRTFGNLGDKWGFVVLRTAYAPGYDAKFLQVLKIIDSWVREFAFSIPQGTSAIGTQVIDDYQNIILDNQEVFGSVTPTLHMTREHLAQIRAHLINTNSEYEMRGHRGLLRAFVLGQQDIDRILSMANTGSPVRFSERYLPFWSVGRTANIQQCPRRREYRGVDVCDQSLWHYMMEYGKQGCRNQGPRRWAECQNNARASEIGWQDVATVAEVAMDDEEFPDLRRTCPIA